MSPTDLVRTVTDGWAADPDGDVVWAGDHDGRRGVRMRQTVRDFTTVWFRVGDRTVAVEAGVIPAPRHRHEQVYRQVLRRNLRTRRLHFALDPDGEVLLLGRIPVEELSATELELVLGEVWETIEVALPPLIRTAFGREKDA